MDLSLVCDCEAPLGVGARVVRADWHHDGQFSLGVLRDRLNEKLAVQWDNGHRCTYNARDSASSLRVYEPGACGTNVRDRFTCSECARVRLSALRWKCTNSECKSIILCSSCYHSDRHCLSHTFRRVLVAPNLCPSHVHKCPCSRFASQHEIITEERLYIRQGSSKVALQGVVPGATVVRSVDWRWREQDGGANATGTVTSTDSWYDEADGVKVQWQWGGEYKYRMGMNGKTDVRMVRASATPPYAYVDHLPSLDQRLISLWKQGDDPEEWNEQAWDDCYDAVMSPQQRDIVVGDLVRVPSHMHATELDWACSGRCLRSLGNSGRVVRIAEDGGVQVIVNNLLLKYNPAVVTLVQPASSATELETSEESGQLERLTAFVKILLILKIERRLRKASKKRAIPKSSSDIKSDNQNSARSNGGKRNLTDDRDEDELSKPRKKRTRQ